MISTICKASAYLGVECHEDHNSAPAIELRFADHLSNFGISYGTKEEYNFRLGVFSENDAAIRKINLENNTFFVDHN